MIKAVDLLAGRAGLHRHQRRARASACEGLRPHRSISRAARRRLSPAEASLNLPLPRPPAWIWLFTTHSGPAELFGGRLGIAGGEQGNPARHRRRRIPKAGPWPDTRGCSLLRSPRRRGFDVSGPAGPARSSCRRRSGRGPQSADFSNAARSLPASSISTMRSTPFERRSRPARRRKYPSRRIRRSDTPRTAARASCPGDSFRPSRSRTPPAHRRPNRSSAG